LSGFFRSTRIGTCRCVAPRALKIWTFGFLKSARPVTKLIWLIRSIWPPSRAAMMAESSE
jgi:hypothetical protein